MRSETAAIITIFIVFVVIPIIVLTRLIIAADAYSCKKTAEKLDYKYEYSVWTGCVLQDTNDKKFLLEQLREIK
jgi:hypothetical protein